MFPVVALVVLTTAQVHLVLPQKTVPQGPNALSSPSPPGVSYSRNQSLPDIISSKIRENNVEKMPTRCKNCGVKSPPVKGSLEYKMRIEMIKQQILSKLHLDEEPKISRPRFGIPRPLVKKFQERPIITERKEPPVNTKMEVVLFGSQVPLPKSPHHSASNSRKFVFHVSDKVYKHAVRTAAFWVYRSKLPQQKTLELTVKDSSSGDGPHIITKTITSKDQGWVSIDVKEIVELWKSRRFDGRMLNISNNCTLEIYCSNCKEDKEFIRWRSLYRPFLVIDLSEVRKSRKKRAIDCRPDLRDCCRQKFYVSFQEMGWDNWIMIPKGFNANYCTGSCYGHILPKYYHTEILQKLALQNQQQQIAPCCSPTKLARLSLIHFDKDENIFQNDIENMIVEECGCS